MPRTRRKQRDLSIEEYEAWSAAQKRVDKTAETAETADEGGGPRLSLVPRS